MRGQFEAEGEIRGTDLLAALVALWREGASGSLQFSKSGATAGFDLSAGEIVGVTSSDPRFETAAILLRAGKLDAATLDRLSAPPGGDRAGVALQAGVLTKREWRWGEKIRAVEVLSDLLAWLEGDYAFFRTPIRDTGDFRLTVPRLVLELFLRSRDRGLVLHYLGGVDVPLARSRSFDSEFATFGLTADAESVVRLIDGRSTAAEIASEAPAEPFAVEKLLAALVTLGLVHPEFVSDAEAATPPRPARPAPSDEEPQEEEYEDAEPPAREEAEPVPADTVRMDLRRVVPPAGDEQRPEPEEEEEEGEEEREEVDGGGADELTDADEEPYRQLDVSATDDERREDEEEDEGIDAPLADLPLSSGHADEDATSEPERLDSFGGPRALPEDFEGELRETAPGPFQRERPLDTTTGVGAAERPRHRSRALPWLLVLLALGVGAILVFRSRERGPTDGAVPLAERETSPTPSPSAAAERAPAAAPAVPPVVPAATATAARPAATAVPTRAPSPRTAVTAPTRATPRPAPAARVPESRQQWLDRAAGDRRRAEADRRARFTVQLELVCELESLTDAWKHDRAGAMWLTTQPFQGKTCFRVFWGRYPSREAALRGLDAAPRFFSTPRNRPIVVPIR